MIFNLFKSKPTLRELIPNGFVDIHSHILPGIDDGAKDIKESLILLSEMKKIGFSKIIGTPHTYQGLYNNTNETIKRSFDLLKNEIKNHIDIHYASEYMIDDSILKRIEEKSLLTIKNNYVLTEMSFISAPNNLHEILFQMQLNDYVPIIAHPERYLFMDNNKFHKLKKIGCKFQLNLLSVTGYYGKEVMKKSDWLLENDYIDFVGSDIHSLRHVNFLKNKVKIRRIDFLVKAIESNMLFK